MTALVGPIGLAVFVLIGVFVLLAAISDAVGKNKQEGVANLEAGWVDRNLSGYSGASASLMEDLRAVLKTPGVSSRNFADSSEDNLRKLVDFANSQRSIRIQSADAELIPVLRQVGGDWKRETDQWAASLGVKR